MNIEGLRPWEYDQTSAWEYDRIRHALDSLEAAKREYPLPKRKSGYENTWQLTPDEGPQFVMDEP